MSDATRVTRTADTDLDPDELWDLVTTGWDRWLVDEADVDVRPGAGGTVVDDGVERTVRVDEVETSRLRFTWWPAGQPAAGSSVELVVLPRRQGSTLRVTETYAGATTTGTVAAGLRWDVRLLLLLVAGTPAVV